MVIAFYLSLPLAFAPPSHFPSFCAHSIVAILLDRSTLILKLLRRVHFFCNDSKSDFDGKACSNAFDGTLFSFVKVLAFASDQTTNGKADLPP